LRVYEIIRLENTAGGESQDMETENQAKKHPRCTKAKK